jgi:hypothetical protein
MTEATTGSGGMWRQLTACVLVCALVIQGMAFALMGGAGAAGATAGADVAGFELCRHDAAPSPDGGPAGPVADAHCAFCLAGAAFVAVDPAPAPEFQFVSIAIAPWPFAVWRLPTRTVDASARPRGPPPVA